MPNADQSDAPATNELLPDPLPPEPFSLFRAWFDEAHARKVQPNPNAMSLATVDTDGMPSTRMVLCKKITPDPGFIVFYTNYNSRKGRALQQNPRAGICFHWDALDRQVRIEGLIARSPAAESDEYFATRPLVSRASAWASEQSRPVASREELLESLRAVERKFGIDLDRDAALRAGAPGAPVIPRPEHWGGFRLWAQRVELWVGGVGRLHDRAAWTRTLSAAPFDGVPGFTPGSWQRTRVQP